METITVTAIIIITIIIFRRKDERHIGIMKVSSSEAKQPLEKHAGQSARAPASFMWNAN